MADHNSSCIACGIEQSRFNFSIVFNDAQHTCKKGTGTTTGSGEGSASAYTFDNYQEDTGLTAIYPDAGNESTLGITYTVLGLIGEAGEIANKWKKFFRDAPSDFGDDSDELRTKYFNELRTKLIDELGDVLWYASQLATELGTSLGDVAADNIRKLNDRKQRDALHGSGDNR